jgi:probable rRNA maturation factor
VDETLVLAVSFDPPESLTDSVFGLDDAALRRVVALSLASTGTVQPVEVSLLLTDDEGIHALNRDYRGRDEATDVLSFPLLDEPLVDAPADQLWQPSADDEEDDAVVAEDELLAEEVDLGADDLALDGDGGELDSSQLDALDEQMVALGDIAISRDAVVRQAAQAGHSTAWELAYLLAHGVLHLVGYDDQTDAGYRAMIAHQEAVLAVAGLAR